LFRYLTKNLLKVTKSWQLFGNYNFSIKFLDKARNQSIETQSKLEEQLVYLKQL